MSSILFENIDAVLIDNNLDIQQWWREYALKHGVKLQCFECVDKFLTETSKISINTIIYLDSNLGNGIIGEIEAKKIFDLGYKNIIITSAAPAFGSPQPWIRNYISKYPPWYSDAAKSKVPRL